MALQKTLVPVNFSQGVDTKTDQKAVVFGKLLMLQHANFTSPGQLTKASGYVQLTTTILGNLVSAISSGQGLLSLNNELLLASNNKLYSFSGANQAWVQKGSILSTIVGGVAVNRDAANDTNPDSALHPSGLQIFAWEELNATTPGVRYSIIDTNTSQLVVSGVHCLISGVTDGGSRPRCLAFGPYLCVLWVDSTNAVLSMLTIPVVNPQVTSLSTQLATNLAAAAPNYDAQVAQGGASILFAYNVAAASTIGVGTVSPSLAVATTTVATSIAVASGLVGGVAVLPSITSTPPTVSSPICAIIYAGASAMRGLLINPSTLVPNPANTDFSIDATASLTNVTGIYDAGAGTLHTYQTLPGSASYNALVRASVVTSCLYGGSSAPPTTSSVLIRSVSVYGAPFRFTNGLYTADYILLCYTSGSNGLQNTYFVVDSSANIVAKILPNGAGGKTTTPHVSNFNQPLQAQNIVGLPQTGPTYQWAVSVQDLLISNVSTGTQSVSIGSQAGQTLASASPLGAALFSQAGVDSATIQFFSAAASYDTAQISNCLHIVGGITSSYDSNTVTETGFNVWPEPVSVVSSLPGVGFTYQVVAVYEWTDAQGNRQQSCPSLATTFSVTAPLNGTTSTAAYTTSSYRLTQKSGVVVAFYRTDVVGSAPGTQFFRATTNTGPLNTTTADTVSFTDTSADPSGTVPGIAAGANLYTFGGVIENIAPPGSIVANTFSNRLWLLNSRNRLQAWYSKQIVPGTPPQFSDLFVLSMDPNGGDITAIASMDLNQVFFKKNVIFAIQGDGPDDTGQQNTFTTPQIVSTDTGCTDPLSVVLTPMGLMYKSTKGIYLLDRSLAVSYIGADVEYWNQYHVVSGDLVSQFNQVRFNMSNGDQLVYDYYMKAWSSRPLLSMVDSCILDVQYFYLDSLGRVLADEPGVYTIANQPYSMLAQTSWLAMSGIAGLQRVYGMMLTGSWQSPHTLKVSIAYDFNPIPSQVVAINAEAFDPGFWGDGSYWGSDGVWGGIFPAYQFRINFTIQKCTSVQITIQDNEGGVNNINGVPVTGGQGYSLSNLTFIVGVKEGWKKVGIERVFS